nr:hypothetical protein [Actinomadura madurae]
MSGAADDTLITFAPCSAAQVMAFGRSVLSWVLSPLANLAFSSLTCGATPTNGTSRLRMSVAAMMPATSVPCPRQSSVVVPDASKLAATLPLSCGWAALMPLSTTATVTPPPRVIGHACSKSSRRCAHGSMVIADAGCPICLLHLGAGARCWVFFGFAGFLVGVGAARGRSAGAAGAAAAAGAKARPDVRARLAVPAAIRPPRIPRLS